MSLIYCLPKNNMASITSEQLKGLIKKEPNLVIIDIRTDCEVKEGRIPNSKWMDVSDKSFMSKISALPKDKTYCLYCASGGRTSMVIPFMESFGFSKVYDLEGGIMEWMLERNTIDV